jgi:hypothetical protein
MEQYACLSWCILIPGSAWVYAWRDGESGTGWIIIVGGGVFRSCHEIKFAFRPCGVVVDVDVKEDNVTWKEMHIR